MSCYFDLDEKYLKTIEEKFAVKKEVASARSNKLFNVFNEELSEEEELALKFLYAYMPLNDMADYDGELFLQYVRKTLSIRDKTPWGSKIPGSIFLHFILPYRVNNENIEDCRGIFFDEIYNRVKDLSMSDAILEVNHWCHEKVTYIGCDPRTSSPLSAIRRALGRCGEESTLLVAALRSLSIPARQCYTPRWAHCDSNHAWVEAWADGKWYFLGACEPEAKLNRGWFSGPARRAMLVHTRVPANYPGPEEVTLAHEWYTEINLLDNYSDTRKITIKVKDEGGNPVQDARVYFQVFNFMEFSSLVSIATDVNGEASLTTGFGDLMIHVTSEKGWGYKKISVKDSEYFEVTVSSEEPVDGVFDFDMVPPPEKPGDEAKITEDERKDNDRRTKEEDRIRAGYEASFVNKEESDKLSNELSLDTDRVWKVLQSARGNSHEIKAFLEEGTAKYGEWALRLLETLNSKDLTDTFRPVLNDHLSGSMEYLKDYDADTFARYILCPRIAYEMIGAYRSFFNEQFTAQEIKNFRENPDMLIKWVVDNVEILEDYTYYQGAATPKGAFELKKSDRHSRVIMFMAMARSFGIPARFKPVDRRPQFMVGGTWKDAVLDQLVNETASVKATAIGRFRFLVDSSYEGKVEYRRNFSLDRFENNHFRMLDYHGTDISEFESSIEAPAGHYRLLTGNRLSDGTVLTRVTFFTVKEGETTDVELVIRNEEQAAAVYGTVSPDCSFTLIDGRCEKLESLLKGKELVAAWIEPDREPSKHIIRELKELSGEFNAWGGNICLCIGDDKLTSAFDEKAYAGLPDSVSFAVDKSYISLENLASGISKDIKKDFPLVFVIDNQYRIRYISSGYKLGIGLEIYKTLKAIEKK